MKWFILLTTCLVYIIFPIRINAHPGRTASDGCHYCRTNCGSWGVAWNARHCHGGYTAPAPTYVAPVPTAKPVVVTPKPVPVVTIKPTEQPTARPTTKPTVMPTKNPPIAPTATPTETPTNSPEVKAVSTEVSMSTTEPLVKGTGDDSGKQLVALVSFGLISYLGIKWLSRKTSLKNE